MDNLVVKHNVNYAFAVHEFFGRLVVTALLKGEYSEYEENEGYLKLLENHGLPEFIISTEAQLIDNFQKTFFQNQYFANASKVIPQRTAELIHYLDKIIWTTLEEKDSFAYVQISQNVIVGYLYQLENGVYKLKGKREEPVQGTFPTAENIQKVLKLLTSTDDAPKCKKYICVYRDDYLAEAEKDKLTIYLEAKGLEEFQDFVVLEMTEFDTCRGLIKFIHYDGPGFDHEMKLETDGININKQNPQTSVSEPAGGAPGPPPIKKQNSDPGTFEFTGKFEKLTLNKFSLDDKVLKIPKPTAQENYKENHEVVGIAIGTSRCSAAISRKGLVEVLHFDGARSFAPYVCFTQNPPLVGQMAVKMMKRSPDGVVFDLKQIIGKGFDKIDIDPSWGFEVVNDNRKPKIKVNTVIGVKTFDPVEIAVYIFKKILHQANEYQADLNNNQPVNKAVITVPSDFGRAQKQAILDAARQAGIEVVTLMEEPLAAALFYAAKYDQEGASPDIKNVLVFDLGGGTLDLSILECSRFFEEKGRRSDPNLGGRDFDRILYDHFVAVLEMRHNVEINKKLENELRLLAKMTEVKEALTNAENCDLLNVSIFDSTRDHTLEITREKFEKLCHNLIRRIKTTVRETLTDAGMTAQHIDSIIFVGGGSKMPMVQQAVKSIIPEVKIHCDVDAETYTAQGAVIRALQLNSSVMVRKEKENVQPENLAKRNTWQ